MISYAKALEILRAAGRSVALVTEKVEISAIRGCVAASDIASPLNVPPFDTSAMDGFAVRVEDCRPGASLKIAGRVLAGDAAGTREVTSGTCWEIMTGAPLPSGADGIVPVELASRAGEMVSFSGPPQREMFIRRTGSDFRQGAKVVAAGTLLGTQHVLPLAALGLGTVEVFAKPKVAFIPTGREVVDDFSLPLASGQIYNSSSPYAAAFLSGMGVDALVQATIADDAEAFKKTVARLVAEKVSLIVSTGAVSAGSHDFIRASLEELGAEVLFHKVSIRPGKPVLFARLPSGTLYLGLPGNPVSTAVGIRFFVRPLLEAMHGQPPEKPFSARVKTPLSRQPGLRLFLKSFCAAGPDGVMEVRFLEGQESHKTSPFLAMNGWAVIPEDVADVAENTVIEVFPLDRPA